MSSFQDFQTSPDSNIFLYMWCGVKRRGLTDGGCVVDVLYVVFVFLLREAFPPFALFGTEVLGGRVGAFDDEGAAGFEALHNIGAHVVGPDGEVGHIVGCAALLTSQVVYGVDGGGGIGGDGPRQGIGASAAEGGEAVGLDEERGAARHDVEGVTSEGAAFPCVAAIAEGSGAFLASRGGREIELWAAVFKGCAVGHAGVLVKEESETVGGGNISGAGETGEGGDEKGILRSRLVGGFIYRELLGREGEASVVGGNDAESVAMTWRDGLAEDGVGGELSVVEVAVVEACIYYIMCGEGCGLKGVGGSLPGEMGFVVVEDGGEGMDG